MVLMHITPHHRQFPWSRLNTSNCPSIGPPTCSSVEYHNRILPMPVPSTSSVNSSLRASLKVWRHKSNTYCIMYTVYCILYLYCNLCEYISRALRKYTWCIFDLWLFSIDINEVVTEVDKAIKTAQDQMNWQMWAIINSWLINAFSVLHSILISFCWW